jgi:hypothetical protein
MKKFSIDFNCSAYWRGGRSFVVNGGGHLTSTSIFHSILIDLNVQFKGSNDINLPKLNFTINLRKNCTDNSLFIESIGNKSNGNSFFIAYLIISVLITFVVFMFSYIFISKCLNRVKEKKRRLKYEQFNAAQMNAYLDELNAKQKMSKISNNNGQLHLKVKKSDRIVPMKSKQEVKSYDDSQQQQQRRPRQKEERRIDIQYLNNEDPNSVYESVANETIGDKKQQQQQRRRNLNLTTNTLQSQFNATATTITAKSHLKNIQILDKSELEFDTSSNIILNGKYSQIIIGYQIINNSDNSDDTNHDEPTSDSNGDHNRKKVMIKILKMNQQDNKNDEKMDKLSQRLFKDSCSFKGLKNKNLNSVTAICFIDNFCYASVYNYYDIGNLKLYLKSFKDNDAVSYFKLLNFFKFFLNFFKFFKIFKDVEEFDTRAALFLSSNIKRCQLFTW